MSDENAAKAAGEMETKAPETGPFLLYGDEDVAEAENPAAEAAGGEKSAAEDDAQAIESAGEETGEKLAASLPVSDDDPLETINEWLGELAPDAEKAAKLRVPVKVDGQDSHASVADLVKSYQIGAAAEKRLTEAKEIKAKAQAEAEGALQAVQQQFAVAASLIERAEKAVDADVAAVDWARLRQEDPAEFAAKQVEFRERRQALEAMKREAAEQFTTTATTHHQHAVQRQHEIRAEQEALLLSALPEWRDKDKAKAGKAELVSHLKTMGFDDADIRSAMDHRLVLMARESMLYRRSQSKVDVAKKRLATPPKSLKPGAASSSKPKPTDPAEILYGAS